MSEQYLVIPDIHNNVERAESLISHYGSDRTIIFLGDYFDNFGDSPSEAKATAEWLKHSIRQHNRIHLMGNHDAPYRWSVTQCPGWTVEKHMAVRKVLSNEEWSRVKLYHLIERTPRPLLLSHAGFTLQNVFDVRDGMDLQLGGRLAWMREMGLRDVLLEIERQGEDCLRKAYNNQHHHFMEMGSRMGHHRPGGPWWVDKREFVPIAGVDQMVGHTPQEYPTTTYYPNKNSSVATTWFVDCDMRCAAIIDENKITYI